jgi:penicillin-insensitive murein endopeptidase
MRSTHGCVMYCLLFVLFGFSYAQADETTPPQAIGFYSNGQLTHADKFPYDGPGFMKLFIQRDRGWVTQDLMDLVMKTAGIVKANYPEGERLQIADVASIHGGQLSLHESHQNGLDADIAYYRRDHREQGQYDAGLDEVFVANNKVTPNFDSTRNWFIFQELVKTGLIKRIFVDLAIKQFYCNSVTINTESTEILRRLRVWPNHDDHFHMRVVCPTTSPQCIAQDDPAPGTGCNEIHGLSVYVPTTDEH